MIKSYQSGFRKGRSTIDPAIYLENKIRTTQVNKESLVHIFFDVEKAHDMMWKEGMLIKLHQMGIRGRMCKWVKNFLTDRSISVRIGKEFSSKHKVENGTPQRSVVSPILSSVIINVL